MKKMRKAISLLLVVVMVLAMSVTVMAATTNITIAGGAKGAEYKAWKLLDATDGGEGKFAYTVNDKYATILNEVVDLLTEEDVDVVSYLNGINALEEGKEEAIRTFADAVYAKVKGMDADATTKSDKFEDVAQGYYLIAETAVGNLGEGQPTDTYSLVMLDTAGNKDITINTKEDVPSLVKKVKEKNDSTGAVSDWQDGADYDIGDDVPFKLTGTVSDKYDSYSTYYYAFHDKMCAGLSFNKGSVVVKVDGNVVTNTEEKTYYTVVTTGLTDGCTFEVRFNDLKDIEAVTNTSKITVEFTATLTGDAVVIGTPGNPNEAKLEYNNNPYHEGDGKPENPGETPWDKVVVFTYKINANKVDGETKEALAGAGFTLYKYDAAAGKYVAVGEEITGVTTFTFKGVDAGKYKLVETTIPVGYNKVADVEFVVEATYNTDSANPELISLVVKDADGNMISEGEEAVFEAVLTDGAVNTTVENFSGSELPETGGMGTTLFYVIGATLVIGAAVVMITKKRMSAN